MSSKRYGSIEAGGTKFVCAIGNEQFEILETSIFPTEDPDKTMEQVKDFFSRYHVDALGIGTFGPIDIDENSATYGEILASPKKAWRGFNFIQAVEKWFSNPIFLTTDVNSSAYGEYAVGHAKSASSCVYVTVGTGIGAGVIQNDHFIGGTTHLEIGHGFVNRHKNDFDFSGVCPYHGSDCFEGVAAGPSIEKRTGIKGEKLSENDDIWTIEAYYLAQLAYNLRVNFAPEKIIFGGGVITERLIEKVREQFEMINASYVAVADLVDFIVVSIFQDNTSATIGNFALAHKLLQEVAKK
ncbi:fructokinase/branched chain amino acid--2-keto-4-methylthiobutyrate aminotransferase [Enterococcus mundtii]|uniref:ROK family protein n=1 Tax=Enterococcus mundtii TaxID=53346 RepID=UPI000D37BA40|nr:ROK family protein [Enterococcus mundtii]PTO40493.1 fructokinase/branched chain amino acid--2-keto-4-methylthiobutyrate aminotransferase [Enterococcus mundtii]PTO44537.1 fructokinase/branched chain amino acid--2-keto-4-methylthiobutyrate aminotransferase [Enterococcus mundtii]